jgi:hypothetical protein
MEKGKEAPIKVFLEVGTYGCVVGLIVRLTGMGHKY